jgi:hypothetical protein
VRSHVRQALCVGYNRSAAAQNRGLVVHMLLTRPRALQRDQHLWQGHYGRHELHGSPADEHDPQRDRVSRKLIRP